MTKNKLLFKGKLLKLSRARKKLPNGNVATLEIIEHPGAALVAPFLRRNKVVMLRQYRPTIGSYFYELPAGTLDPGENPLSCAKREIIEETGYGARKFTKLGVIYPVPGYSTEKITLYKAEDLFSSETNLDKDEIIETKILTLSEVRQLFRKGRIWDAKTICALAYCGVL